MADRTILVTRAWPKEAEERLVAERLGTVTLRHPDTPMSRDEWMAAAQSYDVIMPTVSDKIPAEFYPAAKGKLREKKMKDAERETGRRLHLHDFEEEKSKAEKVFANNNLTSMEKKVILRMREQEIR